MKKIWRLFVGFFTVPTWPEGYDVVAALKVGVQL